MNTHIPVLLPGALDMLKPESENHVLDVTLGLGGHAEAFLRAIGRDGRLVGLDADAGNLQRTHDRLLEWESQCTFLHANFRSIAALGLGSFDIIFADLGVSSPHLDDPERGFTFRTDAPLDLRFDQSSGASASAFLASASEEEIKRVLQRYGELRGAGTIASSIYAAVRHEGIRTTGQLKSVIEHAAGYRAPSILPQIFQALRIQVNDELAALEALLAHAPLMIKPGGRLGVISYHSLEDRMVKHTFRFLTTPEKDALTGAVSKESAYSLLTPKGVKPSESEITQNPRARSAVFRAIAKR